MNNHTPFNSVIHLLEVNKNIFHPKKENDVVLSLEESYVSAINKLMYFINCIWLVITISINFLARYDFALTQNVWI